MSLLFPVQSTLLKQWSSQEEDVRAFAIPGSSAHLRDGSLPVEELGVLEYDSHLHPLLVGEALHALHRSVQLPEDL